MVAAECAIASGADLLGSILVPGRVRTVDPSIALQISTAVRSARTEQSSIKLVQDELAASTYTSDTAYYEAVADLLIKHGPFYVGVFRNQSIDDVVTTARKLKLDFIQLHGSENKLDYVNAVGDEFGIIIRYVVPSEVELMKSQLPEFARRKVVVLPLLDSDVGGEGKVIDWIIVNELTFGRFLLAGGLTPDNLESTLEVKNLVGYDVSGGVEGENGEKDLAKIGKFVGIGKVL